MTADLIEPGRADAAVIKARAAVTTLLVLLAVNGFLPLAGRAPLGFGDRAAAATVVAPTPSPAGSKLGAVKPGK